VLAREHRSHSNHRNENGSRNDQVLHQCAPQNRGIFPLLHSDTNYLSRPGDCNSRARQIHAIPFAAAPPDPLF